MVSEKIRDIGVRIRSAWPHMGSLSIWFYNPMGHNPLCLGGGGTSTRGKSS